jgi:hypothetical protein
MHSKIRSSPGVTVLQKLRNSSRHAAAGALHLDIGPASLGNAANALHSLLNVA